MKKSYILIFLMLYIGIAKAQITDILNFNGAKGANPYGALTYAGTGSEVFGMTFAGGTGLGNIFSIDTNGTHFKTLNNFNGAVGWGPYGSLVLSGHKLYGMTYEAGANGWGIVFSIDSNGTGLKDLYNFNYGAYPYGSLILSGGSLFGMSAEYGSGEGPCNFGNIFRIDTNGNNYKDIYEFTGIKGWFPKGDLTIIGTKLYGMTRWGGTRAITCNNGTFGNIFSIDSTGTGYKDLHDFNDTLGADPEGNLTLVRNKFYGMTYQGGANDSGCIFSIDTNGTNFKDLHDFKTISGSMPYGSLILSGGLLYGTATLGGVNDSGCVFSIDTNGTSYKDIFDFNGANGKTPYGNLTIIGNVLYGMTTYGGSSNKGVVFGLKGIGLGINEINLTQASIKLYPNPNNGVFNLEVIGEKVRVNNVVEVYNMLGEKVYTTKLNSSNTKLDLSDKTSGIYLYRMLTETGNLVSTGRFIIQ